MTTYDLSTPLMLDFRTAQAHIQEIDAQSVCSRVAVNNSSTLIWRIWGAGSGRPALLLLHGGSGSWVHWIRNVLPLARHYTVHVPDLPGLGDSDPPDDGRDIWSVTRCLKTAVDAVLPPAEPFAIAGFSFGGMVSGHLATLAGERLRRIVLVGASGLEATREPAPKLRKLRLDMPPETLVAEARRNLEILMFHDPAKIDGVAIHMQILNTTRARTRSREMGQAYRLSQVLPRVETPLSGIWGEFDSTTHPHIGQRIELLRKHQPAFRMRVIAGAGHWVAYEAAEAFNQALLEALAC